MKKLIALLLTVCLAYNSFAQETVVFSTTSKSSSSSKKNKDDSPDNIIKIAPLSFISGFVPVFYERRLSDVFSIQASVGITTKNYFLDALTISSSANGGTIERYKKQIWSDGNTTQTRNNENSIYGGDARITTTGYIFSVEPRLYFGSEALSGSFMGINLSSRRNNYSSDAISNTSTSLVYTGAKVKEFDNVSAVMVNFGTQSLYDKISLELVAGIGLKKTKGQHYIYSNNTNNGKYVTGTGYNDNSKVAFDLSLRIGYQF